MRTFTCRSTFLYGMSYVHTVEILLLLVQYCVAYISGQANFFKGSLPRDFWLQVFFSWNQCSPGPLRIKLGLFRIFKPKNQLHPICPFTIKYKLNKTVQEQGWCHKILPRRKKRGNRKSGQMFKCNMRQSEASYDTKLIYSTVQCTDICCVLKRYE
jgi:hypothetical protein